MRQSLFLIALLLGDFAYAERIPRSQAAKAEFQRQQPCHSTGLKRGKCPGYIIDHVIALACGGADNPENMQWQTIEEAKAKDKWERKGCKNKGGQRSNQHI